MATARISSLSKTNGRAPKSFKKSIAISADSMSFKTTEPRFPRSGLRFSQHLAVLDAHKNGQCTTTATRKIGPVLLLEKLWKEIGIDKVVGELLHRRRFEFPIERVLFASVLQRLFCPGSDRWGEQWMRQYAIEDIERIDLHHFYRTMGWLGTISFGAPEYWSHTPRRIKDDIE